MPEVTGHRPAGAGHLVRGAYSLVVNSVATSVLGLAFWVVAARMFSSDEVGRDAALVAAMVNLSTICQLNLANAALRFLPTLGSRTRAAIGRGYALTAVTSVIVGGAFVLVAPQTSSRLAFLEASPPLDLLFVSGLVMWGVFALQDAALVALRRATWVPAANSAYGVLKLAALPLLAALGAGHGVFLAWTIPLALVLVPVNAGLARAAASRASAAAPPEGASLPAAALRRYLGQDYLASVCTEVALTAVPLLIVALLGSPANAHFSMPFSIVVAFDLLFLGVTSALLAEGAHDRGAAQQLAALVIRRFSALVIPGAALLALAAPLLLLPFGREYVDAGTPVLRVLALGSLARAPIGLHAAVCRLSGMAGRNLLVEGALLVLLVAGVLVVGPLGILGVAWTWSAVNAAIALAVAPSLIRFLRTGVLVAPR